MKQVHIKTYGCQMNERDSEAVAALLRRQGYTVVDREEDADVILLNTCSVRDSAEQKALGKMAALAHRKQRQPDLVLGFMGCMAQSRGAALLETLPSVDLVVGTQKLHRLPEHLKEWNGSPRVDISEEVGSESALTQHTPGGVTALVSIQQGCDRKCTFCIVPHTRGPERSRPMKEIVEEVRQLVDQGVKEVTLLGQIVTSYGRNAGPEGKFVKLLEIVHEVPGLERLRFTAPHPQGFGDDLVAAYRDLPKLCEHAHLPVQSGSDRVLRQMKRGHDRKMFLRLTERLRAARPGMAISTDLIVGFPGETEEDFGETLSLVHEVEFDQAYLFRYSSRPGTPAAAMPGPLSEEIKEKRHQLLLAVVNRILLERNQRWVGETMEILVEGRSEKAGRRMVGRARGNHIVVFDGDESDQGRFLPIRIERATVTTLYGRK